MRGVGYHSIPMFSSFCVFVASINVSLWCRVYALKARGTGKPGPAEEAGIRVNDIIVSINDTEGINSTEQVRSLIAVIYCETHNRHGHVARYTCVQPHRYHG